MTNFSKEFIFATMLKEKELKPGDEIIFQKKDRSGAMWTYKIIREDKEYKPLNFALEGRRNEAWECGTYATFGRRYKNLDSLFTHLMNNLNENAAIPNKYEKIEQYLF